MEYEVVDIIRPLLIMGGAMVFVMLCRELHQGWLEITTIRRAKQRSLDRKKPHPEEKEADQD